MGVKQKNSRTGTNQVINATIIKELQYLFIVNPL